MKFYTLRVLDDFQSISTMTQTKTLNTAAVSTVNSSNNDKSKLLEAQREFQIKLRGFKPNNVSEEESNIVEYYMQRHYYIFIMLYLMISCSILFFLYRPFLE